MLRKILAAGKFIDQVVTGNVPLVLSDAAAKSIVSLTRYGLCAQSSTPTPSNPVDIKCNNGVLKLVDDELPVGFKRLKSIKFDGDFWYETGEVMTGNDDVTMTLSGTVTTGQNVFGSYNGTSEGTKNFSLYLYGGGSTSNCYLRYGEQLLRPRFGSGERTITFGKSGTSGFYTDVTAEPDTFTTVAGAFIGMLPNSSSPAYTGTIVGNILVGTRLKWIPCERESDGVVGYYEAVKGVFLEPVGTGTPVKGAYDFSLSHIEVVGTPEVLTVQGKNVATYDKTLTVIGTSQGIVVPGEDVSFVANGFVFEPNTRYTISVEVSGEDVTTDATGSLLIFYVDYSDGTSGTFGITKDIVDTGGRTAWTSASGKTVTNVRRWIKAARWTGGTITVSKMQIEMGTKPTAYEPYVAPQTASVPMLLSVGDYKDEAEIISGGVTHRVGIKVLDGTEEWTTDTYGGYRRMVLQEVLNASGDTLSVLCSHYVSRAADARQQPNSIFIASSGKLVIYVDSTQSISTYEEFNTWLAAQYAAGTPVIVLYPLATETTESVAGQALHTVAGTNIVDSVANVSPVGLEIVYKKKK